MRLCLQCQVVLPDAWHCTSCGWEPDVSRNVVQFAPQIQGVSEGYDPSWYHELASLEAGNFWFVGRNRLIRWLARKFLSDSENYLELGCGTGFVLQMLRSEFPAWKVCATEAQPEGIEFAQSRVMSNAEFFQMDACAIPFQDEFDVVGAFDVIEHIPDDVRAVAQIFNALKPGGMFLLSVPQHMFLWSAYDEVGHHFRRYSARSLRNLLQSAGFQIRFSSSFNALLLPLMMMSRALRRGTDKEVDVLQELRISQRTNQLLSFVLRVEYRLIRMGVKFPAGGSRVVVAQKPGFAEAKPHAA